MHETREVGHDILVVTRAHSLKKKLSTTNFVLNKPMNASCLNFFEQFVHGSVPLLQIDPFNGALLVAGLAVSGVDDGCSTHTNDLTDLKSKQSL